MVHHTNCGMETFTDSVMRSLLESSLDTAELVESGWRDIGRTPGSTEGEFIDWLTIDDQELSLIRDVRRLRDHPLVPPYIPIHGYPFDVASGELREVPEATRAGNGGRGSRRAASTSAARTARKTRKG